MTLRLFHRHRWQEQGEFWVPQFKGGVPGGGTNTICRGYAIRSCSGCGQCQYRDPRRVATWVRKDRWENMPHSLADLERVVPREGQPHVPVLMPGEGGTLTVHLRRR